MTHSLLGLSALLACAPAPDAPTRLDTDTDTSADTVSEGRRYSRLPGAMPFGFWGLNGFHDDDGLADVRDRLGVSVFQVASSNPTWTVDTFLPMVRDAGLQVTLRVVGSHDFTDAGGNFDLAAWLEDIEAWEDSGADEFIEDGTLVGHMLLDDIVNYEGDDPTAAEIERMARRSKAVFPGLMTFVRHPPTTLPDPPRGTYRNLDAAGIHYHTRYGDIDDFASEQRARADEIGVGMIFGLNMIDGGDGSSGQVGARSDEYYVMSADELVEYGTAMLTTPGCGMFLAYEYDGEDTLYDGTVISDYFDGDDMSAALFELSEIAADYPALDFYKPAR